MVQCKSYPTRPAINIDHLNEKYLNTKNNKEGRVHQDTGEVTLPEPSSSWMRRFCHRLLSKTNLCRRGNENKWSPHGHWVDLHLQKVLYNNSTYADWYFNMKSIENGKGRGAVWIFLCSALTQPSIPIGCMEEGPTREWPWQILSCYSLCNYFHFFNSFFLYFFFFCSLPFWWRVRVSDISDALSRKDLQLQTSIR